jgi:hypothetical protein
MKKIFLIALAFATVSFLNSCGPDEPEPPQDQQQDDGNGDNNDDDNNDDENTTTLWEYQIPQFNGLQTSLAIDQQNNTYFAIRADGDIYTLFSVNSTGQLNWSKAIDNSYCSTTNDDVLLADNKLIFVPDITRIGCVSTSDGSELWNLELDYAYYSMTYSNNTIYVATSNMDDVKVVAIDVSSGNTKWVLTLGARKDPEISSYNGKICLTFTDMENPPYMTGISVINDNGSSGAEAWKHDFTYSDNYAFIFTPIFADNGNVYTSIDGSDGAYVASLNASSGALNWEKKISDNELHLSAFLLYNDGNIIATYSTEQYPVSVNSIVIMNASNGDIIADKPSILKEDIQMLINANDNYLIVDAAHYPNALVNFYDNTGSLSTSTEYPMFNGYLGLLDFKLDYNGHIVTVLDESLVCSYQSSSGPKANVWNNRYANNANTRSLQ